MHTGAQPGKVSACHVHQPGSMDSCAHKAACRFGHDHPHPLFCHVDVPEPFFTRGEISRARAGI